MLTFLRKIRRSLIVSGSAHKYLVYALGEIALVVIGILIALQINNWNEKQKQITELESYTNSLSSDLIQDIEMVYVNIRQGIINVMKIDSLIRFTKDKELSELSNLQLWMLSNPLNYRPYRWHRAALDELKNSGSLRYMEDDTLIQMIADYEAFTRHMDEDYKEDKDIERGCEEWRHQVVDQYYTMNRRQINTMSYTKERLIYSQMDSIQRQKLTSFSFDQEPDFEVNWNDYTSDSLYSIALEENRPLLTSDLGDVHAMVNCMSGYRDAMSVRSFNELPALIDDAKEILIRLDKYMAE